MNARGKPALLMAINKNYMDVAEMLAERETGLLTPGTSVVEYLGQTVRLVQKQKPALIVAIENGLTGLIKLFKFQAKQSDEFGVTPLAHAAMLGNVQCLELLKEDIDEINSLQQTLLMIAS